MFMRACLLAAWAVATPILRAQECPEDTLDHGTEAATVCPCFVAGERGGAVFEAPADEYPIEILRVGVAWGSQFGGAPQVLGRAIEVYADGLPNPGAPIASLDGPVLTDGFINEFDLEPLPGEVVIDSGPFTVALQLDQDNAGDIFAASLVHDGDGCQPGRNVVFAIPGGWRDACTLGVAGDWRFQVVYRSLDCGEPRTLFIRGDDNVD